MNWSKFLAKIIAYGVFLTFVYFLCSRGAKKVSKSLRNIVYQKSRNLSLVNGVYELIYLGESQTHKIWKNKHFLFFRLDFNMFDITDVATTGVCTDSFEVTGPTGRNPSVICGVNTGQHSKITRAGHNRLNISWKINAMWKVTLILISF